jgi:hypothetical protein
MNRITDKNLHAVIERINTETGSPDGYAHPYSLMGGVCKARVGHYHISHAYGGVALHRVANEAGGVSDVFGQGHMTKRELYDLMQAFLKGWMACTEEHVARRAILAA